MNALLFLALLAGGLADDEAYQEGLRLYREVEFEQALFRFQEAATAPGRPDLEKVELFCWLGMTYAALEREAASDRSFRDALRLDPETQLPRDAPPKLRDRFEELRAEVRAEAVAEPTPPEPEPPPPAPVEAPPPSGGLAMSPILFASAGAAGAAAVVAATAGGLAVALAYQSVAVAEDVDEFQDDRIAALDRANAQLGIGHGLFAAGASMVVVAGGLIGAGLFVE